MEQYTISDKVKRFVFILIGIGVLAMAADIIISLVSGGGAEHAEHAEGGHGHHAGWGQRVWANMLINGFFYFGIAIAAVFFMAVQYAAHAGWSVVFKRLFEAVGSYLPIGAIMLFVVFLAGTFDLHHLYHWMDSSVYEMYLYTDGMTGEEFREGAVMNPSYDTIIVGKKAYLNKPFFWIRAIVFVGVYIFFANRFRKRSLEEDISGGTNIFRKNVVDAAIFLVFFGFTSMVFSCDWIMSIDTHWFSTLFGWYVFSGMWAGAMIVVTLLTIHLKNMGLLKAVNDSHIHDLGKWMFATSFLWSYFFFCQFLLIWYSNIPEEVTYYQVRFEDYKYIIWPTFFINFIFPMLLLM
ncbi:MAG: quinol:cytochrome C oxidoreductase, partial [Salibacteraceae bacterium]